MKCLSRFAVILVVVLCAALTLAQDKAHPIPDSLTALIQQTENAQLHAYFSSSEIGDIAILSIFAGGNACPAMFRVAYPDASGKYVVTKEIGRLL